MRYGFVIGKIGLLVGHAQFRGASRTESGARIELRRIIEPSPPKHTGAEPATPITFGAPLWRVDIFSSSSDPPGNWRAAHHHPKFRGLQPGRRHSDKSLTTSPLAWLERCLRDLSAVLTAAGAEDLLPHILHEEWARAMPRIIDAASASMQEGLEHLGAAMAKAMHHREHGDHGGAD